MQNQTNPIKGYFNGWISILLSVYILQVAFVNLEYNRRGAEASERIANELQKINGSDFMGRINGEAKKIDKN